MTSDLRQRLSDSELQSDFSERELQALTVLLLADVSARLQDIGSLLAESASGSGAVQFSVYDHNSIDELPG